MFQQIIINSSFQLLASIINIFSILALEDISKVSIKVLLKLKTPVRLNEAAELATMLLYHSHWEGSSGSSEPLFLSSLHLFILESSLFGSQLPREGVIQGEIQVHGPSMLWLGLQLIPIFLFVYFTYLRICWNGTHTRHRVHVEMRGKVTGIYSDSTT